MVIAKLKPSASQVKQGVRTLQKIFFIFHLPALPQKHLFFFFHLKSALKHSFRLSCLGIAQHSCLYSCNVDDSFYIKRPTRSHALLESAQEIVAVKIHKCEAAITRY